MELRTNDLNDIEKEKQNLGEEIKKTQENINKVDLEKKIFDLEINIIKNKFDELEKKRKLLFELKSKFNFIELKINDCINDFNNKKTWGKTFL